MTTTPINSNVSTVTESIGAAPIVYSSNGRVEGRKRGMKIVNIGGIDYVPHATVAEALDIIAGYSELYDNLAAAPSEPTTKERRAESTLCRRWTKLCNKVYSARK